MDSPDSLAALNSVLAGFRIFFPIYTLSFLAWELYWSYRHGKKIYDYKEVATNLSFAALNILVPSALIRLPIAKFVFRYSLFHFHDSYALILIEVIAADFCVYWSHRSQHRFAILWAEHMCHHSPSKLNLSVAYRVHWLQSVVQFCFHLPLLLLGFPIAYVFFGQFINFHYQYWLHTSSIGKLGFVEGWINTPASHRVHHACNDRYSHKNFGTILTLWDRIFGTYVPETEPPVFGTREGFISYNPVVVLVKPYITLFRRQFQARPAALPQDPDF